MKNILRGLKTLVGCAAVFICIAAAASATQMRAAAADYGWGYLIPADDLSWYMGNSLSQVRQNFPGMSEIAYGTDGANSYNGDISLVSGLGDAITRIVLNVSDDSHSLCGITTGTSFSQAETILSQLGFSRLHTGIWNDTQGNFVTLEGDNHGLSIIFQHAALGTHNAAADLFRYMNVEFDMMRSVFPEFSVWQSDKEAKFTLTGDGVEIEIPLNEITGDYRVSAITLRPGSAYSLYGHRPGDSGSDFASLGFSEGGSGEYLDPAGSLFLVLYANDTSDPYIRLSAMRTFGSYPGAVIPGNTSSSGIHQAELTVNTTPITAYIGGSDAWISTKTAEGANISDSNFSCWSDNPEIAACAFGHWHGSERNVYVTGKQQGTTTIHIEKLDTGEHYSVSVSVY